MRSFKNPRKVAAIALSFAVITGCSAGVQKDASYDNALKLRDAVIASKVECPGDAVKHDDKYGEDYVKCSENLALSVYDNDKQLNLATTTEDILKSVSYISGSRWMIKSTDESVLTKLHDALGGTLHVK